MSTNEFEKDVTNENERPEETKMITIDKECVETKMIPIECVACSQGQEQDVQEDDYYHYRGRHGYE